MFVPFSFFTLNVFWYLEHKYEGAIRWLANVTSLNIFMSLTSNSNWRTLNEIWSFVWGVYVFVSLFPWAMCNMFKNEFMKIGLT